MGLTMEKASRRAARSGWATERGGVNINRRDPSMAAAAGAGRVRPAGLGAAAGLSGDGGGTVTLSREEEPRACLVLVRAAILASRHCAQGRRWGYSTNPSIVFVRLSFPDSNNNMI